MSARFLALVILIGLVLAPFLPSQRLYVCHLTGAVHTTCCCHIDQDLRGDGRDSGCCTVVVINRFLNAVHPQVVPKPIAQAADIIELPTASIVSRLCLNRAGPHRDAAVWSPPPDQLFVRHCAFLI